MGKTTADLRVVAGEHNRRNVLGQEGEVVINVKRIIQHAYYNRFTLDNDIALLELENELVYNDQISPICLPNSDPLPPTMCMVVGWGNTKGNLSPITDKEPTANVENNTVKQHTFVRVLFSLIHEFWDLRKN